MSKNLSYQNDTLFAFITISIAFTVLVLLITIVVILHKKKVSYLSMTQKLQKQAFEKQLLQSSIEVQEQTLNTLGKELHDNIGQLLTSAKWLVGIGRQKFEEVPKLLPILDDTLSKAVNELRSLSKVLNKEWLEKFSLLENLQHEVKRLNSSTAVVIELFQIEAVDLIPQKQIILFRIIQEGLQNAIKHSKSSNIRITIKIIAPSFLSISIADNGIGFNHTKEQEGQGFVNMKKRTELLGGQINWNSSPANGCIVQIEIPIS